VKIEKTNLPENSILKTENSFEFIDGYKGDFVDRNNKIDIQTIGKLFFSTGPKWIDKLFAFRNKVVKLFGLKTADNISKRQLQLENFKGELGEQVGLFKVIHKTDNEIILGEDDKHLDFRISLFLEPKNIETNQNQLIISTLVKFNNRFGEIYFIPVRPFHKQIVPTVLKGILKEINKTESNVS
jgi:hypothetical protein